jgi:Flp pilus assembly protein TadG
LGLKQIPRQLRNENGSISVLVFGLFAVVLLSGVVLTDISAVIVAQRSLVQATESAAQSAAQNLVNALSNRGW